MHCGKRLVSVFQGPFASISGVFAFAGGGGGVGGGWLGDGLSF